ncbi:MAG: nitrile hydratase subunit beta [Betaproteobacteria bacterium]|nr:nitrile hydratase subunit beta [Betaproteobacteria bacterium]
MDGVHDMGGMDGFGPVQPESERDPVFHAPWEARVLAMTRAMGVANGWTIDMQRFAREELPPHVYLGSTYYQKWFLALRQMLIDHGRIGADEVAAGHALHPAAPLPRGAFTAANMERIMRRGTFDRPASAPARFKVGERVRTKNIHPATHTRLPRYARGHVGVIERIQGCHVFPDTAATGEGEHPQWLYTVVFDARELWGADADATLKVSIEAFESYLDPAV